MHKCEWCGKITNRVTSDGLCFDCNDVKETISGFPAEGQGNIINFLIAEILEVANARPTI